MPTEAVGPHKEMLTEQVGLVKKCQLKQLDLIKKCWLKQVANILAGENLPSEDLVYEYSISVS